MASLGRISIPDNATCVFLSTTMIQISEAKPGLYPVGTDGRS